LPAGAALVSLPASASSVDGLAVEQIGGARRWGIGLAVMVGMMVNMPSLLGSTFSLFLKPVSQEFGWGRQEMSFAVFLALVITTPIYPLVGRLADRIGSRRVALPGAILFSLAAMTLCLTTRQPLAFDFLYLVASIAGTLVSGVVFGRGVTAAFRTGRGRALGICLGVGGGLGAALAPLLAGILIAHHGWRTAYIGLGALPLLIGFPALALLYRVDAPKNVGVWQEEGGALSRVARDPALWMICAIIFFSCLANNGVLVHLAALLTDKGISDTTAVGLVSAVAIATSFGQISSGFLLDRVQTPRVGLPFVASMLAGLLLLQFASSPALVTLGVLLFGCGIGSEYSLIPYYLSRYFGLGSFGQLYGAIYACASIAGGLGPYLMGLAFDHQHSYDAALSLFGTGLAVAIACILKLKAYQYPAAEGALAGETRGS
jgi:MFS family permease